MAHEAIVLLKDLDHPLDRTIFCHCFNRLESCIEESSGSLRP